MAINDSPETANPQARGAPGHAAALGVTFDVTFNVLAGGRRPPSLRKPGL